MIHRIQDGETLEERAYRMRVRGVAWVFMARQLKRSIPDCQSLVAQELKRRGGARTIDNILG
jgi:hypothetical protein